MYLIEFIRKQFMQMSNYTVNDREHCKNHSANIRANNSRECK